MLDDLKTRGRRLIARNRGRTPFRALHQIATFIDESYENEEWDMCVNGEAALVRRLAPAGFTTIVDVGAHVGDWSIEALKAWPAAHAHAFEVAPPTFERLSRHAVESGMAARMTLNACGLGAESAARDMYYFPDHPQLTCDLPRHSHQSVPFRATFTRGDAYVRDHQLDTIDFLKIDVEGAEHLVLEGFAESLRARRIQCLQFEYGAFSIQTRVLLADYYERLGPLYAIGKIYPGGVEFADYDWTMENFRFSNYLCVLRDRPDLQALARGAAPSRTQ
jgi:FkbM family methyltransferase